MANLTVSVPLNTITVNSISDIVTVSSSTANVTVAEGVSIANGDIRAALGNVDPILYNQSIGVFSINNTTLLSGQTTNNLTEGTNLYYTQGRFDTAFAGKTTTDLAEGARLYFTEGRARASLTALDSGGDGSFTYNAITGQFEYTGPTQSEVVAHFTGVSPIGLAANGDITIDEAAVFAGKTTDDLAEGNINLYFTNERVDDRTANLMQTSGNLSYAYDDANGTLTLSSQLTSDDITEGTTQLYYSNTKVQDFLFDNEINIDTNTGNQAVGPFVKLGNVSYEVNDLGQFGTGNNPYITVEGNYQYNICELVNDVNGINMGTVFDLSVPDGSRCVLAVKQDSVGGHKILQIDNLLSLARGTISPIRQIPNPNIGNWKWKNGIKQVNPEPNSVTLFEFYKLSNPISANVSYDRYPRPTSQFDEDPNYQYGNVIYAEVHYISDWDWTDPNPATEDPRYSDRNLEATPYFTARRFADTYYLNGVTNGDVTLDLMNGRLHEFEANGNITGISFGTDHKKGDTTTIIIKQDSTGGRPLDFNTTPSNWTNWKWAENRKTLQTGANAIDVLKVVYDGTNHYADLRPLDGNPLVSGDQLQINGEATITGNLEVQGNIDYVNVVDLLVNDNSITLNYGNASSRDAHIYVDRSGDGRSNAELRWNNASNVWQFNNGGQYFNMSTSTDELLEGTFNKYYSSTLFNGDFATKTTDDLAQGSTNLYYADSLSRAAISLTTQTPSGNGALTYTTGTGVFDFTPADVPDNTDELPEGTTNLYFTTAAANAAILDYTGDMPEVGNITTTGNITGGYISAGNDAGGNGIFIGDINGAVQQEVKNSTGAQLDRGKAVYLTGTATGSTPHVALADNSNPSLMPVIGIVKNNIPDTETGEIVTNGQLNIGTHGFALGSDLFVNGTGDLQVTPPTGEGNLVQKIGKVVTAQQIIVQGAFRTNATPNLDEGNIFIGDTNNRQRTVAPSTNFVSTGNVFDLSNTITGVNSITTEVSDTQTLSFNANAGVLFYNNQAPDNVMSESANIVGDGYGFFYSGGGNQYNSFGGTLSYSGSADLFAIAFAGTITQGSANITVTDAIDAFSFAASGAGAFPGNTAELSNVSAYMSLTVGNNVFGNPVYFPRNSYVQSVDIPTNTITMSAPATASHTFTTSAPGALHEALVNTNTGAIWRFASDYDGGSGPSGYNSILADVPYVNPDAYGYASISGIRISDFTNVSSGSLSDYSAGTSGFTGLMHGRSQLISPTDYPKFEQGLVIGKTTNLSNRGEFDVLQSFGINMMWDGRTNSGNPSKIPQFFAKAYTNNSLAATQPSSSGPRLFFTSAYGDADDSEFATYPRANQELGRLTWWGTSGTNTAHSTTNPPAYISVQAKEDWATGGSRQGGNADLFIASASNKDLRADVLLSYEGGRLFLGGTNQTGGANTGVTVGRVQTGTSAGPQTAYDSNPDAWTVTNYANPSSSSGSALTITNKGRSGTGQVGEMILEFDRVNNSSETSTNYSVGAWGNGQTITDIANIGYPTANTGIASNSVTFIDTGQTQRFTNGQRITIQNATGDVNSSSLNGGTYYLFFQSYTSDSFYTVYTDAALTTEATYTVSWTGGYAGGPGSNFAPFETSWNGDIDVFTTVSGGCTDKKWFFKLPEQSDNLEIFEDSMTAGTPVTRFYAGGNVDFKANVTLTSEALYVNSADGFVSTNKIKPTANSLIVETDGNTHISTDRGVDGQPIVETGYVRTTNAKFDVAGGGFGFPTSMDLDQGSMFLFNTTDAELGLINNNDDGRTGRIVYPAAGSGSNVLKYVAANTNLRFGNTSGSTVTPFDGTFGGSNTEYSPTNASLLTIEFTTYNGNAYVTSWSSVET